MCPVLTSASGFHDESVISKFRKPVASEEASRFRVNYLHRWNQ